ncbi:MAG: TadA family conjugal transfer-associated ATPase [Mycobacteriales bacterium]
MISVGLVERVRARLVAEGSSATPASVAAAVRAEGVICGDLDVAAMLRAVQDEVIGAGPLAAALRNPDVTDVLVNAPDEVWVDGSGGLRRLDVQFTDDAAVRALVARLLAGSGRRLDTAQPWVDARLPGGVRLHAVLPPLARRGTTVSLRVQRSKPFSLAEFVAMGTTSPITARLLKAVVRSRLAVVVTGGTASGKTTLLNALLTLADPADRVVIVEDAAELQPDLPHVVSLEARAANADGSGAVTLRDLVRQALRMRPDRLVVGETRGEEVIDLLAALNTGHDGGLTTLHANSPGDVPARVEALAVPAGMHREAIQAQLIAGVQVVVHLRRSPAGQRSISEIGVLVESAGIPAVVPAVVGSAAASGAERLRGLIHDREGDAAAVP